MRLNRPVRTRFRYGSPTRVNLATHRKLAGSFFKRHAVTATTQQRAVTTLPRLVGTWFQVLFHSPPGVLFTFPSRYLSAIGHQGVFRLSGWSRQIHTEFLGLRATWDPVRESHTFRLRGSYPLRRSIQKPSTTHTISHSPTVRQNDQNGPTTPTTQPLPGLTRDRFSLIRFRSPLLTESRLFSLPVGTEMFHFPTFPPLAL
jgi:hypothetical protein